VAQLHISTPEARGLEPNGINNIPDMELDFICKRIRVVTLKSVFCIVKEYLSQKRPHRNVARFTNLITLFNQWLNIYNYLSAS